jgi:glycosyltransferase involved in cell wall biosynthesis
MTMEPAKPRSVASSRPRLTVGMPVYNGAAHLERALETLLGQSFADFEIVISDNGSTDRTQQISAAYAARDSRIRVVRVVNNRGASWNFNNVAQLARGEFFVWAAHDDEWRPQFLERCVEVLCQRPHAVVCYTRVQPIDERAVPHGQPMGITCEGTSARARWNFALRNFAIHGSIYGVMRTQALRNTRGFQACESSDLVLMTELALLGDIALVDDVLHHKQMSTDGSYRTRSEMLQLLGAGRTRPPLFRRAGILQQQVAGLLHAKLSPEDKRALILDAATFYLGSRGWLYDTFEIAHDTLGADRTGWLRDRAGALRGWTATALGRRPG